MKKMIIVLAMALLVAGAAQAQDQVRKMFVYMNDGSIIKIKAADIQEVTFEMDSALPDVPTTVEEAKAMLVGYWKCNLNPEDLELPDYIEGIYYIVTEDYKGYFTFKIADWFDAEYAGKYVAVDYGGNLNVNSKDPTSGELGIFEEVPVYFMNLEQNSFDAYISIYDGDETIRIDMTFSRVEPFEYVTMGDDYLFKGKPGLR